MDKTQFFAQYKACLEGLLDVLVNFDHMAGQAMQDAPDDYKRAIKNHRERNDAMKSVVNVWLSNLAKREGALQ
jgi:hypothetical protein